MIEFKVKIVLGFMPVFQLKQVVDAGFLGTFPFVEFASNDGDY